MRLFDQILFIYFTPTLLEYLFGLTGIIILFETDTEVIDSTAFQYVNSNHLKLVHVRTSMWKGQIVKTN